MSNPDPADENSDAGPAEEPSTPETASPETAADEPAAEKVPAKKAPAKKAPVKKAAAKKAPAKKAPAKKAAAKKAAPAKKAPAKKAPAKKAAAKKVAGDEAPKTPATPPAGEDAADVGSPTPTPPKSPAAETNSPSADAQHVASGPVSSKPGATKPPTKRSASTGPSGPASTAPTAPSSRPSPAVVDVVAESDAQRATFAQLRSGAPTELPGGSRTAPIVAAGVFGLLLLVVAEILRRRR
ncbi:hypothetical protein VZC37_18350 [Gordonia sp. LSe1-13]|uniref:Nucleoid-structuring protein H-NS n=1 Tax=Gordonia sesuvii TaxID=3116777 RepID=A0ABU7MHI1_9ACTN|nr:hypothetical protein [Gordonia sp. LSe1-13]